MDTMPQALVYRGATHKIVRLQVGGEDELVIYFYDGKEYQQVIRLPFSDFSELATMFSDMHNYLYGYGA